VIVPVIFFSFSKSKLPGYIVPTLPAVAIILGFEVERLWRQPRDVLLSIAAWLTTCLLVALAVALPIYISRLKIDRSPFETAISWIPLGIASVGVAAQFMRRARLVLIIAALVVSGIVVATTQIVLPELDDQLTQKRLAVTAAEALKPGEMIAIYMDKKYNAVFYANGRVVYKEEMGDGLNSFSLDEIADSMQRFGSVIVITTRSHTSDLQNDRRFVCESITEQGRHAALRVSPSPDPR
jgi:4-amino-4-deoxy-L-arabinose transferase-like glycosyltransferase